MIKRYCDICEKELVYHTWHLDIDSKPNESRLEIRRELCFDCAERIRKFIDMAIRSIDPDSSLTIEDLESIIE